ncbi:hypothetical protein Rai3103_02680 [Raineyella fluvialis]|uniref:AbiEi antitoxin N-terminal domain-containing protein n=1 Tax=Raineyella fluvialis TaxID=2662261 RepID=A0A5Q2F7X9_9ACTN|nr:hypothetical protein Rai3103_02680 [Raineyella fluvialis]
MKTMEPHEASPARLVSTAELTAQGLTVQEITRRVRAGSLIRLRRGLYVTSLPDDPAVKHRLRIEATRDQLAAGTLISHISAAVWHGLEVPWRELGEGIHVTRASGGASRRRRLVSHTALVPRNTSSRSRACGSPPWPGPWWTAQGCWASGPAWRSRTVRCGVSSPSRVDASTWRSWTPRCWPRRAATRSPSPAR